MDDSPLYTFPSFVVFDPTVLDGYMKHYVPIPDDVAGALSRAGVTHVEGRLNDHPFRRAIHTRADGSLCLKFGRDWLARAGLDMDMPVEVALAADPDPSRVDVPDELAAEFRASPEIEHVWWGLPPGRQKTLVYDIERARRPETRQKRARSVVDELRRISGL